MKTMYTTFGRWICAAIEQGRDLWFWALTLQAAALLPAVVPAAVPSATRR